jgi:hypothetical protein
MRCSVCESVDSRASTMTLRTPSCSMKAITCCCAPAPIESIAITAETPKIMPEHRQQRTQLVRAQVVEAL